MEVDIAPNIQLHVIPLHWTDLFLCKKNTLYMIINIYREPLFYAPVVFLKKVDVNQNSVKSMILP